MSTTRDIPRLEQRRIEREVRFHLVQRIRENTNANINYNKEECIKGQCVHENEIDKYFMFDHMDPAEFEWGALSKALIRMRENKHLVFLHFINVPIYQNKHMIRNQTFYFIGLTAHLSAWHKFITDQVNKFGLFDKDLKESTNMYECFLPKINVLHDNTLIGWWAINQPIPGVLFVHKCHAERWLEFIKQ